MRYSLGVQASALFLSSSRAGRGGGAPEQPGGIAAARNKPPVSGAGVLFCIFSYGTIAGIALQPSSPVTWIKVPANEKTASDCPLSRRARRRNRDGGCRQR